MSARVRKAVFPVAGLGTRFLPATKATAKEMLPVVDKPLIQYAVEEAAAAGITDMIFVTGRSKRSIEDHFDRSVELEAELESRGRTALLDAVRNIIPGEVTCVYTRQSEPLGLGHAVLCALPAVGDEPFVVLLPDDLIVNAGPGCVAQLCQAFERRGHSIVAVQRIAPRDSDKYGVVGFEGAQAECAPINRIVEKPSPDEAPSDLGVVGRYVLTPAVFDALVETPRGSGGEIQLTDAIAMLIGTEGVDALRFAGTRYDCGAKLGFLQANVELALAHAELGPAFRAWLEQRF